ncbi:MAG TPA: hypothetical protein VFH37_02010 [Candidatus Saccharimonadales bacterium]|nr:hypothetical protein [Candidatus Saccharimonadales bacterium]
MPEENRVFDVAKPGYGQPQATSKPVIVGHQPSISDPMVRDSDSSSPTKISVIDGQEETAGMEHHDMPVYSPPSSFGSQSSAPAVYDNEADQVSSADPLAPGPESAEPFHRGGTTAVKPKPMEPAAPTPGHVEALQPTHVKKKSPLKWLLALLVVALIAVYVLLGTGVIKNSLNLPPFKKKNAPAAVTPPVSQNQPAQSNLPAGFTKYNLSGTDISFTAPTSWGTPNSTTDPGYSKRGGTSKSDGVHAYLVDFPNNKDVEIAVTSAKYLPAARDSLYYDYLQWCTGSADGKFYFAMLQFSTAADKTQTPTTVTCDQGPLTGVTQIDSATIEQPALKNSNGQALGDLYTKNLTNNTSLPVIRVKDAGMTNSVAIKQLLNTIQSTAASGNSAPGGQ